MAEDVRTKRSRELANAADRVVEAWAAWDPTDEYENFKELEDAIAALAKLLGRPRPESLRSPYRTFKTRAEP